MSSFGFLMIYSALCVVVRFAVVRALRHLAPPPSAQGDHCAVGPYALALLAGGRQRAIETAVAVLGHRGIVRDATAQGTLAPGRHGHAGAHPLEQAIADDVRLAGQIALPALAQCSATSAALARIETELTQRGLLTGRRLGTVARSVYLGGPLALLMLGGVWLATHWDYNGDEPMRWVLILTIGAGVVTIGHFVADRDRRGRPMATALGDAVIRHWRTEDPAACPSPVERLAVFTALGVRPPAQDPAATSRSGAPPAERRPAIDAISDVPLVAEDLVLLCKGGPFDAHREAQFAGALLTELVMRGRVAIKAGSGGAPPTVTVIHREAIGDELLDGALSLLGATPQRLLVGGRVVPPPKHRRLMAAGARRRCARGIVDERDVHAWWQRRWRLAEFPDLRPTVVQQLLVMVDGLPPLHDRLHRRLEERGAGSTTFSGWRYDVDDGSMHARVRERVRRVVLDHARPEDPATAYLAAMCGLGLSLDWALDGVSDDRRERAAARRQATVLLEDDPIASAVQQIVYAHLDAFDAWG